MPIPHKCIEHIVVLMMENRSFDHMLGFLPREGHLKYLEGLTGEEFNHDPNGNKILVSPTAAHELLTNVRGVGPPHAFEDVNVQLFGSRDGSSASQPATNSGFVQAWIDSLQGFTRDENFYGDVQPQDWGKVMECFAPEKLPVLTRLAREFVLCDHWFCSVPGPTMPNRLYIHAATSCGYAHNDFGKHFDCRTIYDSLAESGYTWSVYHQNCDIVMNFTRLNYCKDKTNDPNFRAFQMFEDDIAKGRLANYSFINPRFIESWGHLMDGFEWVNSQHAPCDVRPGEMLIAQVYNALRRNEDVWKKTLFVILYDEHGGFHDHVPPPAGVPNPDGLVSPGEEFVKSLPPEKLAKIPRFDFTRLGPRTPAILISPWLPRKLDSTVYEHSSLLATVKKLFNLKNFLTERDRQANSFEGLFEGARLRDDDDTPKWIEEPEMPTIFPRLEDLPLDEVQIEMMQGVISHLPEELAEKARALLGPPCKMTRRQAAEFQDIVITDFTECVIANCGRHPHA